MHNATALSLLLAFLPQNSSAKPELHSPQIFQKVVSVGASVSDGFQNGMLLGKLFDEAIQGDHEPVESITSSMFFMDPLKEGPRQSTLAAKRKPSLLLALDYLFWYGYGHFPDPSMDLHSKGRPVESEDTAKKRLERLDLGLKELEKFSCPIVLGDFPDMWGADPAMLPIELVPGEKTIPRLNEKLYAWAKGKEHVLVLPLAAWVRETKEGKTMVKGHEGPIPAAVLIQEDRLHPTQAGAVVLTARVVEAVQKWCGKSVEGKLIYEAMKVLEAKGIELEEPAK